MSEVLILDGKKAKEFFIGKLKEKVLALSVVPKLVILQIGDKSESNAYINAKIKFGELIGIKVLYIKFKEEVTFDEIRDVVEKFNKDSEVGGIILQLPVPDRFQKQDLLDLIDPKKDVDGLSSFSRIERGADRYAPIPATARGVEELLSFYKIDIKNKKIAVLGRSVLAGGPIAENLALKGGVVTVCHSKTVDEEKITIGSDIVVVAIGKPNFVDAKFFKNDGSQVVVDVGINRTSGGITEKMNEEVVTKIVGDVNFFEVKDIVKAISPVPGGVGQMTVLALFENLIDLSTFNKK